MRLSHSGNPVFGSLLQQSFYPLKYDSVRSSNNVPGNSKITYKEKNQSKIRAGQRTLVNAIEIKLYMGTVLK